MGELSARIHSGLKRLSAPSLGCLTAAIVAAIAPPSARADPETIADEDLPGRPAPPRRPAIQYGVAFTVEGVAAAGPICADASGPCILGSGGGVAVRVGWRPREDFYLGGTYELSKQDPNKLYLLGILQQARVEARHYFPTGHGAEPFAVVAAGVAGYGNEWSIDTWGPSLGLGAGIEIELTGGELFDVSLVYRPVYLRSFSDSSGLEHQAGVTQFLSLEVALEAQDVLERQSP